VTNDDRVVDYGDADTEERVDSTVGPATDVTPTCAPGVIPRPHVQFGLVIDVGGGSPQAVAAQLYRVTANHRPENDGGGHRRDQGRREQARAAPPKTCSLVVPGWWACPG
jgi:hypothetical protein